MSRTLFAKASLVALFCALLASPTPARAGPQPPQSPTTKPEKPGIEVEVKYSDDSTMKLWVLDEKLELSTKHGVLHVAVADIRRIEFATRVSADIVQKVATAISQLNHSDYKVREAATNELKEYKEKAYPQLLKALKHEDPEVSRRADEIVRHIHAKVPPSRLDARETDIVHTDDSKITGRLTAEVLEVRTFQFGKQPLKVADLRGLKPKGAEAEEIANVPQAPVNLSTYQQQFGKELTFSVTGFTPAPGATPNIWGTDVYTLDSQLAAAVVHVGLAKPGETVFIRVRIVQSPPQFGSTFRNGITSTAYNAYPAGAYEFIRR